MKNKFNLGHYLYFIVIATIIIITTMHESDVLPSGYLNIDEHSEYYIQLLCTVITLAFSWLALRLFNMKLIKEQINTSLEFLNKWNIVRIMMIGIPVVINIELYYAFFDNRSFLYCFLITLTALIFCWPQSEQQKSIHQ